MSRRAVAALLVAACSSHGASDSLVAVADVQALPNPDLDVLFVIDNSDSMMDKQLSLIASFPKLMDQLAALPGGLPNVHVAVVTSDMGVSATLRNVAQPDTCYPGSDAPGSDGSPQGPYCAPGGPSNAGCSGYGDDGAFQHKSDALSGNYIIDFDDGSGGRTRNYTGELRDVFTDIAHVGTQGCGFEQHLSSMQRALSRTDQADFLRPEANLAVIILADEDDCSMSDSTLIMDADDSSLGALASYRCTRFGVICDPDDPTQPHSDLTDCRPRADSAYVSDTAPFVDFLTGLKADPRMVQVSVVAGDPTVFSTELSPNAQHSDPIITLTHACSFSEPDGTTAVADPAIRLASFAAAFEDRSTVTSVCDADLDEPMTAIGRSVARLAGSPCLDDVQLADASAEPGLQPSCAALDTLGESLASLRACAGETDSDCFALVADPAACPLAAGNLRVEVRRTAQVASATWTQLRCQPVIP